MSPTATVSANSICPCGTGRTYKRCCMNKPRETSVVAPAEGPQQVMTSKLMADRVQRTVDHPALWMAIQFARTNAFTTDPEEALHAVMQILEPELGRGHFAPVLDVLRELANNHPGVYTTHGAALLKVACRAASIAGNRHLIQPFIKVMARAPEGAPELTGFLDSLRILMYRGWYGEMIRLLDRHMPALLRNSEVLPMGRYQLERFMVHARIFKVLEPHVRRERKVLRSDAYKKLCASLEGRVSLVDWETGVNIHLDSVFEENLPILTGPDLPPRKQWEGRDMRNAARLGAEFVRWAVLQCRIPMGRAEVYRDHAFRYAEKQDRNEAPCFKVEAVEMDKILSDLTCRGLWLDRDLAREYLEAMPLFSQYLNERHIVSDKAHHRVKAETTRLWETLTK